MIAAIVRQSWGETRVIAHGQEYDAATLPALIAEADGEVVGVLTYAAGDDECEIVSIDALRRHLGIGTALIDAMVELARDRGWQRIVLTTTNDNLDALRFYQRRGFRLHTLRPGAVDDSRRLKPSIPDLGDYDIPIRDELELVLNISA